MACGAGQNLQNEQNFSWVDYSGLGFRILDFLGCLGPWVIRHSPGLGCWFIFLTTEGTEKREGHDYSDLGFAAFSNHLITNNW